MDPMHKRRRWRSRRAKARHKYHERFTKVKHWRAAMAAAKTEWVRDVYDRLIVCFIAQHREQFGLPEVEYLDLPDASDAPSFGVLRNQHFFAEAT